MEDELKIKIIAHVDACSVCSAANQRVNDFCMEGQMLFYEWAKDHSPTGAAMVEISKEQYDRLVEETLRRQRSAANN